jgi:hypothetical protein
VETLTGIGGFCKKIPKQMDFCFFFCPHFGAYGLCTPPPGSAQPPLIFFFKCKGVCKLPGADMQKPYAPKCGQGKIKIDLFRDFLQKLPMSKL